MSALPRLCYPNSIAQDADPEWRVILVLPNGTKDTRTVEAGDREAAIEKAKSLANSPNAKLSSVERMPS